MYLLPCRSLLLLWRTLICSKTTFARAAKQQASSPCLLCAHDCLFQTRLCWLSSLILLPPREAGSVSLSCPKVQPLRSSDVVVCCLVRWVTLPPFKLADLFFSILFSRNNVVLPMPYRTYWRVVLNPVLSNARLSKTVLMVIENLNQIYPLLMGLFWENELETTLWFLPFAGVPFLPSDVVEWILSWVRVIGTAGQTDDRLASLG